MENAQQMNDTDHQHESGHEAHDETNSSMEPSAETSAHEADASGSSEESMNSATAPTDAQDEVAASTDAAVTPDASEESTEPKKKRLSTGMSAAKMSGSTLKAVGVATTRMAVEKASTGTDQIPEGE